MVLKEDIKPISYIKAHTADTMKQVNLTQRPVFVTQNGVAKAVIMDTDSYEKLIKAVGLFKLLAQGEKDILNGKYLDQDKAFDEVENMLKEMAKQNE